MNILYSQFEKLIPMMSRASEPVPTDLPTAICNPTSGNRVRSWPRDRQASQGHYENEAEPHAR